MKINKTKIKDLVILKTRVYSDRRGSFKEIFKENELKVKFKFDCLSYSKKNTLRGMHIQTKNMQAKLLTVAHGKILDVVIDLRKKSKTFGKVFSIILSKNNALGLYIPAGFAHAYFSYENENIIYYKLDNYYNPKFEFGIDFNDPTLDIKLPRVKIKISKKDRNLLSLDEFKKKFKFL